MNLVTRLLVQVRLACWRKALKADQGFNLALRNAPGFLRALGREQVRYVVLHWYGDMSMQPGSPCAADGISLLVEHGSLPRIAAAMPLFNVGRRRGKVTFNVYSDSGRSGLSYQQMPYYPPVRARYLLDSRTLDPRGWYRIAAHAYLPALVYHLVYHQRLVSGLPLARHDTDGNGQPQGTYCHQRLLDEATREGVALPPLTSLPEAHRWLQQQGWAMPFDLIRRLPDQDAWLGHLYASELARLQAKAAPAPQDLVVLVTRQETREHQHEQYIVDALARHGTVLRRQPLTAEQTRQFLWWARGGNWLAGKHYAQSAPDTLITCQLPAGAADVIKAELRRTLSHPQQKHNWLHTTDDLAEALYYQQLVTSNAYPVPPFTGGQ